MKWLAGLVACAAGAVVAVMVWGRGVPLREVEIVTERPGARLVGSLILPAGAKQPVPVVVLLHGSGSDGRGNAYYGILSRAFAEEGYATLVYDKRGSGESTGRWIAEPFQVLIDDAVAMVAQVRKRAEVQPGRIVVWGGSEGATIAPEVAVRAGASALIAQSATGVPFWQQNRHQNQEALRRAGASAKELASEMEVHAAAMHYARTGKGGQKYLELRRRGTRLSITTDLADPWWKWYGTKMDYEPARWLRQLKVPVLAIWGERDALVPVEASRKVFRDALAGNPDATLMVVGNADHSLSVDGSVVHVSDLQRWLRGLSAK